MSTDLERLRHLLADEGEDSDDAAVQERIQTLDALDDSLPPDRESDLAALSVLGDDTRYRLARYLAAAEDDLCVCELAAIVEVGDSATSHALADLHDAGLVTRRRSGQWRYYDATERAERLLAALDDTRAGD